MKTWLFILITGAGATLIADLWALVRRRLFGTPLPNFGLVGRWVAHLSRGRLRHEGIARTREVRGELAVGWIAHYLIGIGFAALPVMLIPGWMQAPTLPVALLIGAITVAAPFFILQPALGAGVAARHLPRPGAARLQSFIYHLFFGLGLYLSAAFIGHQFPSG